MPNVVRPRGACSSGSSHEGCEDDWSVHWPNAHSVCASGRGGDGYRRHAGRGARVRAGCPPCICPAGSCVPISRCGRSRTQDSGVVTFVELLPEGGRPDDEQVRGWRIRTPVWLTRAPYLALGVVIVGAVLAGDSTTLVRSAVQPVAAAPPGPTAGFVYADRGPCPLTVSCEARGQARIDLWASYNHLFPDTQTIASSLWYAPATGTVYRQELDATGASGDTIILIQQRISGSVVPFGPNAGPLIQAPPLTCS